MLKIFSTIEGLDDFKETLLRTLGYELEPFGIKVVIVEPGVIRTNFANGLVVAKKSQDPNSPYSQMMKK